MSRNSSGTYSLPTGNPVVSGTIIEASWANSTLSDIASALTDSLSRSGQGSMSAALRIVDGTVSVPGIAFGNETGSGAYRAAAGDWYLTVLGSGIARIRATGIDVTGDLGVSGTISGNLTGNVTGNASTATTLQTARTINGTSFNGSANITTASWGTSRTVTIGSTGKSVDGSANVSWSLTEIGAPSTSGTGATGTWGISISGNAGTVTDGVYASTTQTISGVKAFTGAYTEIKGVSGAYTGTLYVGSRQLRNVTSSNLWEFVNAANTAVIASLSNAGDLSFNSGYGSAATAYGCRAWVNFNGTGTVAIRASGNVSSITDNGVGDYTVNFATAMPNNNYAIVQGVNDDPGAFGVNIFTEQGNGSSYGSKTTTSSVRLRAGQNLSGAYVDCGVINLAFFR
jgi:hypothetical protein